MGLFSRMLLSRMLQNLKGESIERSFSREHHDVLMTQLQQQTALIKLKDKRQVIECVLPDSDEILQTIILDIDLFDKKLTIDEPNPSRIAFESLIGKSITLRHQHQQMMLSFSAMVLDYNTSERSLSIDLPYQAEYQPRRIEPRVEFSEQSIHSANINPLFGAPWYAMLKNISHGGMRIAVAGDLRDQLHKNLPIQRCDIDLGFKKPLICGGRVKSFSFYTRPYRHTLISIMFDGMSENDAAYLDDFLLDIVEAA